MLNCFGFDEKNKYDRLEKRLKNQMENKWEKKLQEDMTSLESGVLFWIL